MDEAVDSRTSVTFTVQSKFMQNYRVASAVDAGSEVVAIQNAAGQIDLFSIGTAHDIHNFYPDPTSDTGYSSVSTGLSGTTLAVGQDNLGKLIVFAGSGTQVNSVKELDGGSQRWSAPATLTVPTPRPAITVASLFTVQVAGDLYLAALTRVQSASPGPIYFLSYLHWSEDPVFVMTPFSIDSTNCVWSGTTPQDLTFLCVDTIIAGFAIATGKVVSFPMQGTFDSLPWRSRCRSRPASLRRRRRGIP